MKRSCDNCEKILDSKYFPYKSVDFCLWCYEKIKGRTHRALKAMLGLTKSSLPVEVKRAIEKPVKQDARDQRTKTVSCPSCTSSRVEKKGIRHQKQRYVCKKCGKNWTADIGAPLREILSPKKKGLEVEREISIDKIKKYLKDKKSRLEQINFYYRDDTYAREIDDYYIDDTYIYARGRGRKLITFRIDRIRKL